MKKFILLGILGFSLSCSKDPGAKLSVATLDEVDNWYYSLSPTYESNGKRRSEGKSKDALSKAMAIKHNLSSDYKISYEEINYNFISNDEVIIKLDYAFTLNEKNEVIYRDTYYYDLENTPIPIPLKIEPVLGGQYKYSIIEKF